MNDTKKHPAMVVLEDAADTWVIQTVETAVAAGAMQWVQDPANNGVWGLQAANLPSSDRRAFIVVYPTGQDGSPPDFEMDEIAMEIIHRTSALPDGIRD